MARHYALRASNSDRVRMCVLVRDIRKDLRDSYRPPRKHFPIVAIGAGDGRFPRHHRDVPRGRLSAPPRLFGQTIPFVRIAPGHPIPNPRPERS